VATTARPLYAIRKTRFCKHLRGVPARCKLRVRARSFHRSHVLASGRVRFLFWNLQRKPLLGMVSALVEEHGVDVLLLAESGIADAELLSELNARTGEAFAAHSEPLGRVKIIARLPVSAMRAVSAEPRVSMRHVAPPGGVDVLLVVAHLKSKLRQKEIDQVLTMPRIARMIEEAEERLGIARTIVVGDLNMNPFEYGLVAAEGLHAVMSRGVAASGSRTVDGAERPYFYNPMWSLFGDATPGPPGTYYRRDGSQVCYFWNIFDQVLVRPEFLGRFRDEGVRVLTSAGGRSLLRKSGTPDAAGASDHLPLLFEVELNA
jgi:hypothetical protein